LPASASDEKKKFRFEPLDPKKHERAAFSCEQESLDAYLKERANQEIKKQIAAVYVLTSDGKTIAGYYTLSQYAIETGELPPELIQKLRLPKYDKLPATLLGRLARSKEFKGQGIGELLLMGALKNAWGLSRQIASVAVVVDAINEKARSFYRSYGFIELPDHPNRLFIPMQTLVQLFSENIEPQSGRRPQS
jgi:predicted GNAT family N-acyltransferase